MAAEGGVLASAAPAKPRGPSAYAASSYWDRRYSETHPSQPHHDWFYSYTALSALISHVLGPCRGKPCLHVGCGNSNIQEGMASDGFLNVTNVDISEVVIDQMKLQHDTNHALHYHVMDCRDMGKFPESSFHSVVDKGTMDAVLCAEGGAAGVQKYLTEVDRILVPGGVFLLISLGEPKSRIAAVSGPPGSHWHTEVLLLPKPAMLLNSEASLAGRIPRESAIARAAGSKDDPPTLIGPLTPEEASSMLEDLEPGKTQFQQHDFLFAYVCRKAGCALEVQVEPSPGTS